MVLTPLYFRACGWKD